MVDEVELVIIHLIEFLAGQVGHFGAPGALRPLLALFEACLYVEPVEVRAPSAHGTNDGLVGSAREERRGEQQAHHRRARPLAAAAHGAGAGAGAGSGFAPR